MAKGKQFDIEEAVKAKLDANGHELVSSIPMAPPLGYQKQPSVNDRIRAMVRGEMLRQEAEKAGAETFEESDDFDVDDDPELKSPYELSEVSGEVEVVDPAAKTPRTPPEGGAAAPEPTTSPSAAPGASAPPKP